MDFSSGHAKDSQEVFGLPSKPRCWSTSPESLYKLAMDDIAAYSVLLGKRKYFMGIVLLTGRYHVWFSYPSFVGTLGFTAQGICLK